MFTTSIRLAIIVIALGSGCFQLTKGNRSGFVGLIGAAMLIFGFFRYGPIRPAFLALNNGRFSDAERLVASIKFPNLLNAESRAYLHWIQGVLATRDPGRLGFAEEQMQLAIDGNLRTSNDRSIATATLAQIVAQTKNLERAIKLLDQAENIPHSPTAATFLAKLRSEIEAAK